MYAIGRIAVFGFLIFCWGLVASAGASPVAPFGSFGPAAAGTLSGLYNLNYENGTITVFQIVGGVTTVVSHFRASTSGSRGLAVDHQGRIYTTVTPQNSKPCSACIEVFGEKGDLLARIQAPILPGAPGAPNLDNLSLDAQGNIYVSDYGQQAVYFYSPSGNTWTGPTIVVQNSTNAASVAVEPDGDVVFVSGGCGFASVRPYVRTQSGYQPGACFSIGTIALIGGAASDGGAVFTPVDGAGSFVSVSSEAGGGTGFTIPDPHGQIGGIALATGGAIAYVGDHHGEKLYAYARPPKGWLSGVAPKLLTSYVGFQGLDVIAIRP